MKISGKLIKFEKLRFSIVAAVVGLLFAVFSLVVIFAPKGEMLTVDGTIVSIEESRDISDDFTDYTVLVDYTDLDGVSHYGIEYPSYHTGMKVGDTVTVSYSADDTEAVSAPGTDFIPYVFLAVGAVLLIVGIAKTVSTVKTPSSEMSQFDKVDKTQYTEEAVRAIEENDEPECEYYFHWCGKLNQSYVLETTARNPVYEARCDKIGVLSPYIYTFVDHRSGKSETKSVTHTSTVRYGTGSGVLSWSVPVKSSFNIDGEDCFEKLGSLGYSLDMRLEGLKLNFDVMHLGVKVARLEAAGVNVAKADSTSALGDKLTANGVYRVYCKDSDIPAVFLAAFAVSRTEFT